MNKREARERLIDAGLLALAKVMEERGPMTVLQEIFGEDTDIPLEVFANMMRKRELWDAHLNGERTATPPPTKDTEEIIFIPGRAYPNIGARPVRWGTITKIHFSEKQFRWADQYTKMETLCGLTIPQLAVVLPMDVWHPGSDETCKLCVSLKGDE